MGRIADFFNRNKSQDVTKGKVTAAGIAMYGLAQNAQNGNTPLPERDPVNPHNAGELYEKVSMIRACADKIANAAILAELRAEVRPTAKQEWKIDQDSAVAKAIKIINPKTTRSEYLKKLVISLVLYDRAYVAIENNPEYQRGTPKDNPYFDIPWFLYPMNPRFVKVVPDANDRPIYEYAPTGFRRAGTQRSNADENETAVFQWNEVIAMDAGFSPKDDFRGQSKLNAAVDDIEISRAQKLHVAQELSRNININGVITTDTSGNEDNLERIRLQLEKKFTGNDAQGRILVLESGWDFKPVNRDTFTLQTTTATDQASEGIRFLFGVPLPLFTGDAKDLSEVSEMFWETTVLPYTELIAEAHDKYLANNRVGPKNRVVFKYTKVEPLRKRMVDNAKVVATMVANGVWTPNDGREFIGYGNLSEGADLGDKTKWGDGIVPLILQAIALEGSGHMLNDRGNANSVGGAPSASSSSSTPRDQSSEPKNPDSSGRKDLVVTEENISKFVHDLLEED